MSEQGLTSPPTQYTCKSSGSVKSIHKEHEGLEGRKHTVKGENYFVHCLVIISLLSSRINQNVRTMIDAVFKNRVLGLAPLYRLALGG